MTVLRLSTLLVARRDVVQNPHPVTAIARWRATRPRGGCAGLAPFLPLPGADSRTHIAYSQIIKRGPPAARRQQGSLRRHTRPYGFHSPAGWRVATLRRFLTLVPPIALTTPARAGSSRSQGASLRPP